MRKVLSRMKKWVAAGVMIAVAVAAPAQTDPEYRAEIGVGAGLVSYQGDFNGSIAKNMQPGGGLVAKYRFNPRMALGLNVTYGKLKGSSADVSTWYPEFQDSVLSFSNTVVDAGLRFEYNFWPYGTGREYFGARRFTPFIAIGLGLTYAKADGSVITGNLPIGAGLKYKVGARLNLALEWTMHFSLSDKLDGTDDPYGIESSGIFKNTDSYSILQLSLTYDIWAKCKTCHNDRF